MKKKDNMIAIIREVKYQPSRIDFQNHKKSHGIWQEFKTLCCSYPKERCYCLAAINDGHCCRTNCMPFNFIKNKI